MISEIIGLRKAGEKEYPWKSNPYEIDSWDEFQRNSEYAMDPASYFSSDSDNPFSYGNVLSGGWWGADKNKKKKKQADEYQKNINMITDAYREILGRDPDAAGLQAYIDAINAGQLSSANDIRNSLMASDEYAASHPSEEEGFFEGESSSYNPSSYELDPELQAKLEKDFAKYDEILSSLGISSPEREKQITEAGEAFKKEFLEGTQTDLENSLVGKGLRGSSIMGEQLTNLFEDANTKAKLYKEDLFAQDEATKLAQLNALQNGLGADYATKLGFMSAADDSAYKKSALDQSLSEFLMQNALANRQLDLSSLWNDRDYYLKNDVFDWQKEIENKKTEGSDDFLTQYGPTIASFFGSKFGKS